jgi:hypothetical protein
MGAIMETQSTKKKITFKKITITIIFMVIIAVLSSFGKLLDFWTDFLWFKEVGYTSTYIKQVFAKLYIGIPFFVAFTVFIYLYLQRIKSNYYKYMNILTTKDEEKTLNQTMGVVSVLTALFFSFGIAGSFWMQILKFINATSFNIKDPIFIKDIGFYVFTLPLVTEIFTFLLGFIIFLMLITIVIYIVLISIRQPMDKEELGSKIRRLRTDNSFASLQKRVMELALDQIMLIGVVFFAIVALRSYLASFGLLYSETGAIYGAGFTDINVTLGVYRIQIAVSIISAIALILARYKRNKKLAAFGPIALVAVYLLGIGAEMAVQAVIVSPNELARERKYITNSLEYTKMAYGLDDIDVENFSVDQNLTYDDLLDNQDTISNISLNDYRPTKEAYNQLQGLRNYYKFHDVDIDRYIIDGKLTQMFLSVRELDKEALDDNAKTWVNQHLKYTHGYGLTMSPVNKVTSSGQPSMVVRNVPPVSDYKELEVTVPQIYFGELTNDYVVVNTDEQEFDYPMGEELQTTKYQGTAGIKLNFLNKVLYSIREGSFKLLVSGGVNSDSKIIINRNIMDRVNKIAPFLSYDEDPYAVVVNGKIYYIIDGYTTTKYFPYAEPFNENANYIRNSFKVIIDAYNGDVNYYIVDEKDPLVETYSKIFPKLFKPMSDMPKEFVSHLRYPQTMFDIQAKMYGTYHTNQPDIFYNREDKWEIAKQNYQGKTQVMESLYFTFELPGEGKPEFVLSIPYTPTGKQNMTAFLVARNDGDNYGKLKLYEFPKSKTIIGPEQVEARISNNDVISRDLALWDSRGSQVLRGNILTIPINSSILYIEPLYIRADSEKAIPEVRRIIASYNDKVVMEDTLEKALTSLFGGPSDPNKQIESSVSDEPTDIEQMPVDSPLPEDEAGLIKQANELYEQAQEALKSGSLSEYEKKINELGNILKLLEQ